MSLLDDVNTAISAGAFDRAADLAATALDEGERDAALFNILGFRESEAGRYRPALALLDQGLALAPQDANLLYSRGFCLFRLGRDEEALGAFNAALDVRPHYAAPLHHKGMIYERNGQDDAAERFYAEAQACDPRYEDPYAGLASVAATRGDFVRARDLAQRALAISPGHTTAHLALAKAEFDEGRFETVVARLEPILADPGLDNADRPAFLALLGDALDGLKRPDEAFAAWTQGKALSQAQYAGTPLAETAHRHLAQLAALRPVVDTLGAFPPGDLAPAPGGPKAHIFLVGFPRSGTTLLEQVLASHDEVVTLEERPLLETAELEFLSTPEGLSRLMAAGDDLLDPYRELYWRLVADHGLDVRGKVFIDKLPLASLLIPLIARLFPGARFLFAERDPRDVVLSCFRRAFKINPGMYQFVTLDGAARFYDGVMSLAHVYRGLVADRVHAVRYEALVADFEGETRAICDFIGLPWTESLRDFAATARGRTIRTPSAAQVRKGLYATGAGQWRRYESQLAPVLPILAPWVSALGYDTSDEEVAP